MTSPYQVHSLYRNDLFDSLFVLNNQLQQDLNCKSIEKVLDMIYNLDQLYRDSVEYYRAGHNIVKMKHFGVKMKEVDNINSKTLMPLIDILPKYKECINNSNSFNAIWLVAIHSRNYELIRNIYPLIEYGYNNGMVNKQGHDIYIKNYNNLIKKQK